MVPRGMALTISKTADFLNFPFPFYHTPFVFIFILFQTAESSVQPPLSLVNWDALCSVQEVISGIIP